jgi:hypothetical protein
LLVAVRLRQGLNFLEELNHLEKKINIIAMFQPTHDKEP